MKSATVAAAKRIVTASDTIIQWLPFEQERDKRGVEKFVKQHGGPNAKVHAVRKGANSGIEAKIEIPKSSASKFAKAYSGEDASELFKETAAPKSNPALLALGNKLRSTAFAKHTELVPDDDGLMIAVYQRLAYLDDKQVKEIAKKVAATLGFKLVAYKKRTQEVAFAKCVFSGTTFYIGTYTSYDGVNDGGIGGIAIKAAPF